MGASWIAQVQKPEGRRLKEKRRQQLSAASMLQIFTWNAWRDFHFPQRMRENACVCVKIFHAGRRKSKGGDGMASCISL